MSTRIESASATRKTAIRKISELPTYYERLLPRTAITRIVFIDLIILSIMGIFVAFDYASFVSNLTRGLITRSVIEQYFTLKPQELVLHLVLLITFSISFGYWSYKPRRYPMGETFALGMLIFLVFIADVFLTALNSGQYMRYSLENDGFGWIILATVCTVTLTTAWLERYVKQNQLTSFFDFDPKMIIENVNTALFILVTIIGTGILLFHPFHNVEGPFAILFLLGDLLSAVDLDVIRMLDRWFFILVAGWRILLMTALILASLGFYYASVSRHVKTKLVDPKLRSRTITHQEITRKQRLSLIGLSCLVIAQTINDGLSIAFWILIPLISLFLVSKHEFNRIELYIITSIVGGIFAARAILTVNLDISWYNISLFSMAMFLVVLFLFLTLAVLSVGYLVSIGLLGVALLITFTFWDHYIYVFIGAVLTILGVFWFQLLQNIVIPSQELCNSGKSARRLLESDDIFWKEIKYRFSLSDELANRIQSYVYSTLQNDREKVIEIIYEPEKPYNAVIFSERTFYRAFFQSVLVLAPVFMVPLVLYYLPFPALGLYLSPSVGNFAVLVIIFLYLLAVILIWLPPVPIPKFREMELEYRRFKQ